MSLNQGKVNISLRTKEENLCSAKVLKKWSIGDSNYIEGTI